MEASCAEAALVRDVLAGIRPYDVLDEGGIARLVGASSVRRLAAHEVLLHDEAPVTSVFILTKGYLTRSLCSPDGKRMLLNNTYPVTSFGCAAAFNDRPHVGVVEAMRPSEVVVVPIGAVRSLLEENPTFALAMARSLAHSSVRQTEFLRELLYPVPVRLARLLCRRLEGSGSVELAMTKTSLAEMLATVPETLSRALGTLRSSGLVQTDGRTVRVLDETGLREYAQL